MKGKMSDSGDTRISPNGYHYTRVKGGWELTHRLMYEKHVLKRKLVDGEQVRFRDRDRTNLKLENLYLHQVVKGTTGKRIAILKARIEELQAQLKELEDEKVH